MTEAAANTTQLTTAEKVTLFFLPNVGDIVFLFMVQIPLFLRSSFVFGDGSTGWHLATGEWILQNHRIPYQDLVSYSFPNKAWVAYEWLSDVFMALLVKIGGLNLLALSVSFAIGWLFVLLYARCRREGAHFLLAMWLMIIGAIITFIHWLARPVLWTFYGVYLFSTRLEDFHQGRISWKQLTIPLALFMVLWVNTHPAFLFGFVLLAIYLAANCISLIYYWGTEQANAYKQRLKGFAAALGGCFAASLINPYGVNLYVYIVDYLKGSIVLAANDEFASPIFHGTLQPVCLELLFALFIVSLTISRNRLSLPRLLTCIAFSHLALSAVRNMPLYVIIILPAIAQLCSKVSLVSPAVNDTAEVSASESGSTWRQTLATKWQKMTATFDENETLCNKHFWPAAMFVVLFIATLNGGKLLGNDLLSCNWSPENKPTKTLDYLKAAEDNAKLDPNRGFNYDNWGGYLRYRLGKRVFIDDRSDFYATPFYIQYSIVFQTLPGWQKVLDEHNIQWVLTPKNSRLGAVLLTAPGWEKVSEDPASYLVVRKSAPSETSPKL